MRHLLRTTRADLRSRHRPLPVVRPVRRRLGLPRVRQHAVPRAGGRCAAAQPPRRPCRAFPGVRLLTSGRDGVLDQVPAGPALVVYRLPAPSPVRSAATRLRCCSTRLGAARPPGPAGEEALRRWLSAAALVRSASAGGKVVIIADSARRPVQGLLRWDPWWASARKSRRPPVGAPPAGRTPGRGHRDPRLGRGPPRGGPPARRHRPAGAAADPRATGGTDPGPGSDPRPAPRRQRSGRGTPRRKACAPRARRRTRSGSGSTPPTSTDRAHRVVA